MAAETFPGFGLGPNQPKAEKTPRHHHRGRAATIIALSVGLVGGATTAPWWWPHGGKDGSASTGTGADGGNPGAGGGIVGNSSPNVSSKPSGEAGGVTATTAPAETYDASVDMTCTLGATAVTRDGTRLRVTPTLLTTGGHPDKSRFYTVADVVSGNTQKGTKNTGTYVGHGFGAAVTATVPIDFQFPRDDVLVGVVYIPDSQPLPSSPEGFSVSVAHPGRVQIACGNAAVTYAIANGGIQLPAGG